MEAERATKFIHELLELLVKQKGSDLFITAGFPPAVKVDGKIKRKPLGALGIDQIFRKAAAGDPKFAALAVQLQERYLPQEEAPSTVPASDDPDLATLRNYLAWHDQLRGCDDADDSEPEEDLS